MPTSCRIAKVKWISFDFIFVFSLQLSELEQRVIEAEERAEEAEDKVILINFSMKKWTFLSAKQMLYLKRIFPLFNLEQMFSSSFDFIRRDDESK